MRNLLVFAVVVALLALGTVLAALNPGQIVLDLAFTEIEMPKSLALSLVFGAGWVFGLVCAAVVLLKCFHERRKLRRALRLAETEVHALRSMPIQDAD